MGIFNLDLPKIQIKSNFELKTISAKLNIEEFFLSQIVCVYICNMYNVYIYTNTKKHVIVKLMHVYLFFRFPLRITNQ